MLIPLRITFTPSRPFSLSPCEPSSSASIQTLSPRLYVLFAIAMASASSITISFVHSQLWSPNFDRFLALPLAFLQSAVNIVLVLKALFGVLFPVYVITYVDLSKSLSSNGIDLLVLPCFTSTTNLLRSALLLSFTNLTLALEVTSS